jgi:uncharacterized membrane protein
MVAKRKKSSETRKNYSAKKKDSKNLGKRKTSIKSIMLVIICTILTSTGQILFKYSTSNLGSIHSIITNIPLLAGFIFYGLGAIVLILALREGELSILYPFIALSFVWVALLSIQLFGEHVSLINWLGIVGIIFGVSLIGYGSGK